MHLTTRVWEVLPTHGCPFSPKQGLTWGSGVSPSPFLIFGALDVVGVQTSPILGKRSHPLIHTITHHGVKTEKEPLCMLGSASLQSSHIACFKGLLSLLISGTFFSFFSLGGLGLCWPQLLPSTHKGSSFPMQLNPYSTLCFLQFLFGPGFPWSLHGGLSCGPCLLLHPKYLPSGMAHLMYSHLCSVGLVIIHLTMAVLTMLFWWGLVPARSQLSVVFMSTDPRWGFIL